MSHPLPLPLMYLRCLSLAHCNKFQFFLLLLLKRSKKGGVDHVPCKLQDADRCCHSDWHCCVLGGCNTICSKHLLTRFQCTIFHNVVFHSLDAGGFSRLFPAKFTHRKANTSVLQVCSSHDLHPGVTETNYTDI